jgi:hypothetical protein
MREKAEGVMTDSFDSLNREARAKKIGEILGSFYDQDDPIAALRDLLADARHYADAYDLDYADEDRVAYDNYSAERMEFEGVAS